MSDAIQRPPTFEELVGLIKKLYFDYLEDVLKNTPEERERSWKRYETLNHLYQDEQQNAIWIKCSDRLPGYTTPVKWRDGKDHSHATTDKIPLIDMAKPFLTSWEWLDEHPNEQPVEQIRQDTHEKEIMMKAFVKVRQIFEGRQWIMDGRGSYPYNDDRYREEVRYMYNELDALVKDTWANIKSHSSDYRRAIIAEYLKGEQKENDAVDIDELWDEHSEHIDDDIDSLSRWAGSTVVDKEQFRELAAKLWERLNQQSKNK